MSDILMDYWFGDNVANGDVPVPPATIFGGTIVAGPGAVGGLTLSRARRFGGGDWVLVDLPAAAVDPDAFSIRLVVRVMGPVTDRQNLFEAGEPACSIHLLPRDGAGDFRIAATVDNARNGWRGVVSGQGFPGAALRAGGWLTIDLAYDQDTLVLLVNGQRVTGTAFPDGALTGGGPAGCIFGLHPSRTRWGFRGEMAYGRVTRGVAADIETQTSPFRGGVEWLIGRKEHEVLPGFPLGERQEAFITGDGMVMQRYPGGMIAVAPGFPPAHHIHGPILAFWDALADRAAMLGPLLSDLQDVTLPGAARAVFLRGAVWWSAGTGAWAVTGQMYLDYERMGGSTSVLGLPTGPAAVQGGGVVQPFQTGILCLRDGATRAYAVVGAILGQYLATGGIGAWGYPLSDETDVVLEDGSLLPTPTGARRQSFERCTMIWSVTTGAHEVHGAIADAYLNQAGGPGRPRDDTHAGLGLPVSDEIDMPPGTIFGRYSAFQHGVIVWNGAVARLCPPFRIKLGLVQTEEDEGFTQGENDLFFRVFLYDGATEVFSGRFPPEDAWDGDNSHDLDLQLDPLFVPRPDLSVRLKVEVWDEDGGLGFRDNRLGTLDRTLSIGNGWGLLEQPTGVFADTGIDKIKRFEWQVTPDFPPSSPLDFWEIANKATPNLIYDQYAAAFTDIDDDPEWTDPGDWAQREVFGRLIKPMAKDGNCFGFCTEALAAWYGRALGLPLSRFTEPDWETVRNRVNIGQIGWRGDAVLSFISEGRENGIAPVAVFNQTRDRDAQGERSFIVIWMSDDYGGAGHSVIPVAWNDTVRPWEIEVFDPNSLNVKQKILIDPDTDTYTFNAAGLSYGQSMEYVPWGCVDHRQCSPAWDPSLLLLALTIIAVGQAGRTTALTDADGGNLWMPDNPLKAERTAPARDTVLQRRLRTGHPSRAGQFQPMTGPDGALDGELLVRRTLDRGRGRRLDDSLDWDKQSLSLGPDFVHTVEGVVDGDLDYLIRWGLGATRITSPIRAGMEQRLAVQDLDRARPRLALTGGDDRLVSFEHTVRLGRSADILQLRLTGLPVAGGGGLEVSVSPGLTSVDVLAAADGAIVPVEIRSWRGSQAPLIRRFEIKPERSFRLTPMMTLAGDLLRVGAIETLGGAIGAVDVFQAIE